MLFKKKASSVLFDEREMEQAIGRQLNKTREFLGVEKGKKLSEISEQIASACEISEKQMQDVVSADRGADRVATNRCNPGIPRLQHN